MTAELLVIEDDEVLSSLICKQLRKAGYKVAGAADWVEADRYLESKEPDLILMDVRVPNGDGLERLPVLVDTYPVIILTAFGSVRDAVDSMKKGASDYLLKPISPEELMLTVERVLENSTLRNEHQFCQSQLRAREKRDAALIGESGAFNDLRQMIDTVAQDDITVLVLGESGSGKELVARSIHKQSPRSAQNFVTVDCCTLQERLFESELFGHEKGSFTGADRQKRGLIEGAHRGTLFLDEIGEIDASMQAKLLRVLETHTFRRLGGTKDLDVDVRIVAATNRDLEAMADAGEFRKDLFFRLNGISIFVPPLRERREDIPLLAEHFLRNHKYSRRGSKMLSPDSVRKLVSYDWPGNVRELKNVVERAIILSREKQLIRSEHLAFGSSNKNDSARLQLAFDHDPTLEELEARYLEIQLRKYSGRRAQVAEAMGISERSVYRMIKRYGLAESA